VKLEIPGQFGGPECRPFASVAVALRRLLEPVFADVPSPIGKLVLLLRVSGTQRDFGGDGPLSPTLDGNALVCEIELKEQPWAGMDQTGIRRILADYLLRAIDSCVRSQFLPGETLERAERLLAE